MKFPLAPKTCQQSRKNTGRASFRIVCTLAFLGLLIFLVNVYSAPPDWWTTPPSVINQDQDQNNYSAVTVGQLKNMAVKAKAEMDIKFSSVGGAGPAIDAMVQGWITNKDLDNQYAAATVGQVKAVAKLFYDRLVAVNARPANLGYPWTTVPPDQNYAVANVGQVKHVFSFAVPVISISDTDEDGIPDDYESAHGLSPTDKSDGLGDADGDGVPNLIEYRRQTDLQDVESKPQPDRVVDIAHGADSPTDNIFSSLQEAYNAAQSTVESGNWEVIQVRPGLYRQGVDANVAPKRVAWIADSGGEVVVSTPDVGMRLATDTVIHGFKFLNGGTHIETTSTDTWNLGTPAIWMASSNGCLLRVVNTMIIGWKHRVTILPDEFNFEPPHDDYYYRAGGIQNMGGDLWLVHTTLLNNSGNYCNGILNQSSLHLINSILWDESNGSEELQFNESTVVQTSIIRNAAQYSFPGVIDADPQLTPSGLLTLSSLAAINQGTAGVGCNVDMYGQPRPDGTLPDIGAMEWKDSDTNGLPDFWEMKFFGHLNVDPSANEDMDVYDNAAEYANGTDATNYYNGDVYQVSTVIAGGDQQYAVPGRIFKTPLTARIVSATNEPMGNASVLFEVIGGASLLEASDGSWHSTVTVKADGQGYASARLKAISDQIEEVIAVDVSAGTAAIHGTAVRFHETSSRRDEDHDGLADFWETEEGLDPTNILDGLEDWDADGAPNLVEYLREFEMADATSTPSANRIVDAAHGENLGGNDITYPSLQAAYDAVQGDWEIIYVTKGTYPQGVDGFASPKKVIWLAASGGEVLVKSSPDGFRLSADAVIDGFVLTGNGEPGASGTGIVIKPHSTLGADVPNIRVVNTIIRDQSNLAGGVEGHAGAVINDGGNLNLVHVTICDNRGTDADAVLNLAGTVHLTNSIVEDSAAGIELVDWGDGSHLIVTACLVRGVGYGILGGSPMLTETGGHLTASSYPCFDSAISNHVLRDIHGQARPMGSAADLGAEEWVDSSGNGIPDWWETAYFQQGYLASSDAMALLNQYLLGVYPASLMDSDLDGVSDARELQEGTDPLDPASSNRLLGLQIFTRLE